MSWQAYEAAKASWTAAHPGATPEQYDAAMRANTERRKAIDRMVAFVENKQGRPLYQKGAA
jgi:hypothetical protein